MKIGIRNKQKEKKMKRLISVLICVLCVLGLAACGSNAGAGAAQNNQPVENKESQPAGNENNTADQGTAGEAETEAQQTGKDVLVVYFSATGTTKAVAEKIAAITGADTYEIKAAQEYTDEDLNWSDSESRSTKEQNDPAVRPEIGNEPVSLEGYSTIYIGFPIWWGEEPRIMDTFVESNNFDGITMIPFCTSSSSGIGMSGKNLAEHAGSGTWLDGQRFGAGASEEDIQSWISGLQ